MIKKGYILIEVLISISLISLILIPLGRQTNQYLRLKKSSYRLKNIELREMKLDIIKGYDRNLLEGKPLGSVSGIGSSDRDVSFILIEVQNERIKKVLFSNEDRK